MKAKGFRSRIHPTATPRGWMLNASELRREQNPRPLRACVWSAAEFCGRPDRAGIVRTRAKIGLQNLANIFRLVTLDRIAPEQGRNRPQRRRGPGDGRTKASRLRQIELSSRSAPATKHALKGHNSRCPRLTRRAGVVGRGLYADQFKTPSKNGRRTKLCSQ